MLILGLALTCEAGGSSSVEKYKIDAVFDLDEHKIDGKTGLVFNPAPKQIGFLLNKEFDIKSAEIEGRKLKLRLEKDFEPERVSREYGIFGKWDTEGLNLWTAELPRLAGESGKAELQVEYSGSMYTPPDNRQFSREKIAFEVDGTIGEEGIFLSASSFWYPRIPDRQAQHTVTAHLPKGWNGVTAGKPEWEEKNGGIMVTHISEAPLDGINFSAAPWEVKSADHNGVQIMTYFLPAQAGLADGYIESCKRYIDMYSGMLATYPFPKFAVVDNFLPSGYGMPGWTLLGSEVLRLPFIRYTSLGHEVLHNWFGNSMLVDYRGGNWCEGITAYLADHKYKQDRSPGGGKEYRRDILRDYAAYVNEENDYPAVEFVSRSDAHDRTIGYGKVTMIFHTLNLMIQRKHPVDERSDAFFHETMGDIYKKYQWKAASWKDLEREFGLAIGRDMTPWFDQWLRKPGAPEIKIDGVEVDHGEGMWNARFHVLTLPEDQPYRYPLTIRAANKDGETVEEYWWIKKNDQEISLHGKGRLQSIYLDPDFDVFRKIYPNEVPLTLAAFYGDPDGVLVVPSDSPHQEQFQAAAEGLKKHGQKVVLDRDLTEEMMRNSLWIFGYNNSTADRFAPDGRFIHTAETGGGTALNVNGESYEDRTASATLITEHPAAKGETIVYTYCLPDADPVQATRKLPHYGKYSFLVFEGGQNVAKGEWEPEGGCPMIWRAE